MSYTKMMKQVNNHRKDKNRQPVLAMPFNENEHVESYTHMAYRTATGYNVRVYDKEKRQYIQVSEEFKTENEAVEFLRTLTEYDQLGARIYSTEGMHISGW